MSENPGPPSTDGPAPGEDQRTTPVDTGPGPNEADVNQERAAAPGEGPGQEDSDAG